MGEMVHIRLDPKMRNAIKKVVAENTFANESEFIKEAIRERLELYKKIQILESFRGTIKPVKNPKVLKHSEVFRAFGLE